MRSLHARIFVAVAGLATLVAEAGTLPGGLPAVLAAAAAATLAPFVTRRDRSGPAATRRSTS